MPWWGHNRELDPEDGRPYVDVLGRSAGLERPRLEAEDYVALASGLMDVEASQLASRRRDSSTGRLRRIVASCGVERRGKRAAILATVLNKHPVVVSRWVREGSRLREEENESSTVLEELDKALSVTALERLRANRRSTRNRTLKPQKNRSEGQSCLGSFPSHRYWNR